MNLKSCIDDAGGVYTVAAWIGKTPRAMYKWLEKDSLPRTEYTGQTNYSEIIEQQTNGKVSKETLLKVGLPKKEKP